MSRLFVDAKAHQFINDITKEFTKDIVGAYIILFPVSIIHTKVHTIYDEAVEKVFENAIKLDVLAGQPNRSNKVDSFGFRNDSTIELYIQPRDLLDKGLEMFVGDFFVYGDESYEIVGVITIDNIFGQVEYDRGVKVTGQLAKHGEFNLTDLKNTLWNSKNFIESGVQKRFVQQRGLSENEDGVTNDRREMRERLGDDMAPIALGDGPRKIDVEQTDNEAIEPKTNTFYHE